MHYPHEVSKHPNIKKKTSQQETAFCVDFSMLLYLHRFIDRICI